MKISQAFPGKYLKAEDLQGAPVRATINSVVTEEVDSRSHDVRPVVYFQNQQRGLVLNVTNANLISQFLGDETDNWRGHEIEIYPTTTEFAGKIVPCLRVRAPNASAQAAPPSDGGAVYVPPSAPLNDDIPW